jgi:hypothetical protein
MVPILDQLRASFTQYCFEAAPHFAWSPKTQTIYYQPGSMNKADGSHRLLHELSHAELGHANYRYDIELIRMEVAAWQHACLLAKDLRLRISAKSCDGHLETYRNWLYARSRCPTCQATGLQNNDLAYACSHCRSSWQVPRAQLCRIQRRRQTTPTPV